MRKAILSILLLALSASLYAQDDISIWEPDEKQAKEIKTIAETYVYYVLSDERIEKEKDSYPAMFYCSVDKNTINRIKHAKEIDRDFTVGGFSYRKYKIRISGSIESGKKIAHVDYYDPAKFPDRKDDLPIIMGGFPSYFSVTVDYDAKKVIDHYASPL